MTGAIEMDRLIVQSVRKWVNSQIVSLSDTKIATIHLDDLLKRDIEKRDSLDVSAKVFCALIENIKNNENLMPVLVIALECVETFDNSIPDLNSITEQLSDEPPSIYLLHREVCKYLEICEEYKYPLSYDLINEPELKKNIYWYYRIFRGHEAIQKNWEYSRCIYATYFHPRWHI